MADDKGAKLLKKEKELLNESNEIIKRLQKIIGFFPLGNNSEAPRIYPKNEEQKKDTGRLLAIAKQLAEIHKDSDYPLKFTKIIKTPACNG
jgi:hypothetical protein